VPILQRITALDVTEVIESTTVLQMLDTVQAMRHGKNLKEDDQSWDEAFTNYKFTPRQTELMN